MIGDTSSEFHLEAWNEKFANWDRCPSESMLAVGRVIALDLSPFAVPEHEGNYSWLVRSQSSAVPLNVSVLCYKNEQLEPATACQDTEHAADVYALPHAYELADDDPSFTAAEADGCVGMLCERTREPVLLGLLHVQRHVRGAPQAEQHFGPGGLRYQLTVALNETWQEAHAWTAYGRCAVVLVTDAPESNKVVCLGANETNVLHTAEPSSRFVGAFRYMVEDKQYLLLLLAGVSARSAVLFYQENPSTPPQVVNDTARHSANWVGVHVDQSQGRGAALGIGANNALEVRVFRLQKLPMRLQLAAEEETMKFPTLAYAIIQQQTAGNESAAGLSVSPWMRYSRVLLAPTAVLVVGVESEQVVDADGASGGSRLLLKVCAGAVASRVTGCQQVTHRVCRALAATGGRATGGRRLGC